MKKILLLIILFLSTYACDKKQSQISDLGFIEDEEIPITERMLAGTQPSSAHEIIETDDSEVVEIEKIADNSINSNKIEKKIIKDGRIGIEVDDLELTKNKVDILVKSKEGYYANDRFDDSKYESSYILKIRIPSVQFENLVSELSTHQGKINYKEINARDVTSQFIDLETRLANKRKYLERYGFLLKKANTVKDILQIENEIRDLEEEIESTVGRLKYLKDLVGYSTLDLVLTKKKDFKYNPKVQDSFLERLKQSLSNGWNSIINFLLFLIRIWPFLIIISVLFFYLRKYRRKRTEKK